MNATIRSVCVGLSVLGFALLSLTACGGGTDTTTALPASSFVTSDGDTVTPATSVGGQVVCSGGDAYRIYSPDGKLWMNLFYNDKGDLTYNICAENNTVWLRDSDLGCYADRTNYYDSDPISDMSFSLKETSYSLLGNISHVTDSYTDTAFTLTHDNYKYTLEVRMFDDGAAIRYKLPARSSGTRRQLTKDTTTFALRSDVSKCWYGVENKDYEPEITAHSPKSKSNDRIMSPLTAEVKGGGYISLMEGSASDTYGGTGLKALGNAAYISDFWETGSTTPIGSITSAWKLINIADDLNSLVNNTNVYSVCDNPNDELFADTSWITPGRSTWSWGVDHSAPTLENMLAYTEAAAKLGFEYNIIDDGWPAWSEYKAKLAQIGTYGDLVNVNELLWGAVTVGTSGANKLDNQSAVNNYIKMLNDCKLDGAKVDFWWSEADYNTTKLQKYILEQSAKNKLVINFHGCNKNTGLNKTYPNELSREGVRGIENIGLSTSANKRTYAEWITSQLFTRYLCGHADWTPATYNAMEIGSIICIDSPLMVIAAKPEDVLASDAVEFIKSIPTVWDKTIVLSDSKIGSYAVYAKEKDGVWFVGGVSATTKNTPKVTLSEFLPDDGSYLAEIWEDRDGSMVCTKKNVSASDVIELSKKTAGTGFAIRLSKLELSAYGGESGRSIAVTTSDAASTVKYTTDGSDPLTSQSAKVCGGSIDITGSCLLRVALTDKNGKTTSLSCRFNNIISGSLDFTQEHSDGKTTLTLPASEGVLLYYTANGSTPTEQSALYTEPLTFDKSTTVKVLAVNGDIRMLHTISVAVAHKIDYQKPDIFLTDASPISAVGCNPGCAWGIAHIDEANFDDNPNAPAGKISLGGGSSDSGTKFDRGLSTNATGTYVYAVPEGVSRFVGVVGIDDCTFDNPSGKDASAQCIISFDGKEVYRSAILRRGEYTTVDLTVPEGAKEITIVFGDGGNGPTCDNVSMGDPGWMK